MRKLFTRTHGMRHSPEWRIWTGMKQRCLNPKNPRYLQYGGRGVTVCESWANSFEAFFADMGPRPSHQHTLDRRNNAGNYEPGNCRWATPIEQQNNTTRNRIVEIDGEKMTLAEADRRGKLPVSYQTVATRLCAGWTAEQALSTPSMKKGETHIHAKLSEGDVRSIRQQRTEGATQDALAAQFSVAQGLISRIVNNKIWRNV